MQRLPQYVLRASGLLLVLMSLCLSLSAQIKPGAIMTPFPGLVLEERQHQSTTPQTASPQSEDTRQNQEVSLPQPTPCPACFSEQKPTSSPCEKPKQLPTQKELAEAENI